ncbi:hypothetical protein D3C85_202020 [compost metagenome]
MPRTARGGRAQRVAPQHDCQGQAHARHHAPFAHIVRQGQHHAGQHRQLLFGLAERRHHLRHHIAQQEDHDDDRHAGNHRRVDEGRHDLAAQGVAFFDVVRQLFHHLRQVAGFFTRADQCAIDLGKVAWPGGQRGGQAVAGAHIVAHGAKRCRDVFFLRLFKRGGKRGIQRQARRQQAGQLARQPCHVGIRQAGAQAGAQAFSARGRCRRQGQQATAAQLVAGAALGVGVDRATHDFAQRVGGFVAKGRHGECRGGAQMKNAQEPRI